MVYGYIRVSTVKQTVENQRHTINDYVVKNKINIDEFIELEISSRKSKKDRLIDRLINELKKDDVLICAELSRLGRSTPELLETINTLVNNGVRLIFIKQNIDVSKDNRDISTKILLTLLSLMAEVERDFISIRTKEALASRKRQGKRLGHKTGDLLPSKYDEKANEILTLLNKDIGVSTIIKLIGFGTRQTLTSWKNKRIEKSQLLNEFVFNDKYKQYCENKGA